jgi:hypothetical protein
MTSLDKNEVYSAYSDGYLTEAETASLIEYIDSENESSYTEGVLNGVRILKAKNAMKRVEKSKQKLLDEIRALKAKRDKLKIDADNTAHNMMGGIKARNLEMKVNHVNNQIKKKLMEYNKLKAQTTSIDDEITSSEE